MSEEMNDKFETAKNLTSNTDFCQKAINVIQAIVLVLDKDARIVTFNKYMEDISGYKLSEVQGKDWFATFLPEEDHERIMKIFKKAIVGTETRGNVNPILTKDGKSIDIEWYDTTLFDDNGDIWGVVAVGQDVTDKIITKEQLDLFREQINWSEDGFLVIDPPSGNILDVNNRICVLTQFPRERLLQMKIQDLDVNMPAMENWEEHINNIKGKGSLLLEGNLRRKDSMMIPIEVNVRYMSSHDREFLIASVRDITVRKENEHKIKREKEFTNLLIDSMSDIFYVIDATGKMIKFNRALEKITGYSKEEIMKMRAFDFFPKGERKKIFNVIRQAFQEGYAEVEANILTKDGTAIPMLFSGQLFKGKNIFPVLVGVAKNITQRKKHEEELREHKDRLDLAIEGADLGLFDWDIENDQVVYSDLWINMLGYDRNDIPSNHEAWENLLHPEDKERAIRKLRGHLKNPQEDYKIEFRMKCKDGQWKWIHANGKVVKRDPQENPVRMVGIHVDITEQKMREEEIKNNVKDLELYKEVTIGREEKMIDLKKQVNQLSEELGRKAPFDLEFLK